MPCGTGPLLGSAFPRAQPWQRYVLCLAMIVGGGLLVALGHVGGGLLAAAGVLALWRMVRLRSRRSRVPSTRLDEVEPT